MTPPTPSFAEECEQAAKRLRAEFESTYEGEGSREYYVADLLTQAAAMARENEDLRHDIERHIGIASEYAQDAERWRFAQTHSYGFMQALLAEERGESLCGFIDAAIANEKKGQPEGQP